ncbi:hypothetical protein LZG37_03410 [Halomonas titanicae]|uniref:hypothetical protein n=1 Tax=Vreelandella titanicae TaxID=664683 RepID=UPI001F3EEEBC|nr:hypothetical protein [Halomonas titanicae]MCE7517174.1 hypothetical protein [Halomonas titanicae]
MEIDLNNPSEFTMDNVAKLVGSKDDSQHRQLRVTSGGIAFLSDEVGNVNTGGLAFRFETWGAGNSYCGSDAAADSEWVSKVYGWLSENWPNPKSTIIDY